MQKSVPPVVSEPTPDTPDTPERADVARAAGRGGLAITFAKAYFMVVGMVQQIALSKVLGQGGYGAFSSAFSIASTTYNPVVTTSIQAVSRAVTQSGDAAPAALRRVLYVHGLFSIALALGFFIVAPMIAESIGAPHVVTALRILSGVMLVYGIYTPLVGALNGQRRFFHQAMLDILSATLRTVGLVIGAWWFMRQAGDAVGEAAALRGVEGSAWGFVVSALLVLLVALAITGIGRAGKGGVRVLDHLTFAVSVLVGQVLLNLLLQADLTLLRAFAADAATQAGLPLTAADPLVGAYRQTQFFSFLPYQLLLAVTFILFPMLASAVRDGDREAIALYVKTGVRLALIVAGLMVSITSGLSDALLHLLFGEEAARYGGRSLEFLSLGFGAFAIFGILITVLNSLKRERAGAIATGAAVVVVAGLCVMRVRGTAFGEDLLFRTAIATSSGLLMVTLIAAWLVKRSAGAVVELKSLVRVLGALAIAITVGRFMPYWGKIATLLQAAAVAAVYVIALLLLRELGKRDLEMVKNVVRRRRRA